MSTVLVVTADLNGDPSDLLKAFQQAEKASREFANQSQDDSKKANSAWDSMKGAAGKLAAGLAAAFSIKVISDFVGEAINQAANLQQSVGAVDAVFKDSSASVHEWAQNAATDVGLSTDAYNGFAAILGTQMKTAGFSLEEAAGKTNDLIGTSADLASMFGGTTADAVSSLSAAFRGEYDSVEKYGLAIKESDIQGRLAAKGMGDLEGAAYRNARAQELLAIIQEQSADAAGNFARENDTLQGQQQRLTAEFENAQAEIGANLLPAMTALAQLARDVLPGALAAVQNAFVVVGEAVQNVSQFYEENASTISFVATVLLGAAAAYGTYVVAVNAVALATKAISAATKAWAAVQLAFNLVMNANPIMLIITAIGALVAAIIWVANETTFFQDAWAAVSSWFVAVWTSVSTFFTDIWNNIVSFLTTVFSTISSTVTSVFTGIASFFTTVWQGIVDTVMNVWNAVVAFLTPIFDFIATLIKTYVDIWVNVIIVMAAILKTIWDGIVAMFTAAWEAIVAFVTPIVEWISDFITTVFTAVSKFWNDVWKNISKFFSDTWNNIRNFLRPIIQWVQDVITNVVNGVRSTWARVWTTVLTTFMGIWNGLRSFFSPIIQWVQSIITNTVNGIRGTWTSIWSGISSFFSNIWNGMKNAVSSAISWIGNIIGTIQGTVMGALSGAGRWLVNAGSDMIRGLWNGISDMFGWITSKISGFLDGIVGWAKDVLGIASPSKVMMEVGYDTGAGMAVGLDKSHKMIVDASMNLIPNIPDPKSLTSAWDAQSGMGTYGVPPWMAGGAGGGSTVTHHWDVKIEGRGSKDDDELVDELMDKAQFAWGGTVAP